MDERDERMAMDGRTDGVVKVPVPQVVDRAPRPAHDECTSTEEEGVFQWDGWGHVECV